MALEENDTEMHSRAAGKGQASAKTSEVAKGNTLDVAIPTVEAEEGALPTTQAVQVD